MEIKIQLEKELNPVTIIGTEVSEEENIDYVIGKITAYDPLTGMAICTLNPKK